jgi:CHAD domain-containing protein
VDAAREHPPGGVAAGDALHAVRKTAKRVRYTAEMAEPVLGAPAAELVACAKEVQEVLGARQDTVVTRERCRVLGIAAGAAGGESAWTWGRLHALEEARAHDAERRFWELEPALHDAVARARAAG